METIKQAVILAGGYGTRLKPFTDTNPKPMYPFEGKPFLYYLLKQVKSFGIDEVILLLGYLPEKIIEYCESEDLGLKIDYCITDVECETGLRLRGALDLMDEQFLLMYCDNYCPINYEKLVNDFFSNKADIQFTAYLNADNYTKSNLKIAEDGKVLVYDKKRETANLLGVDIGYGIVKKEVVEMMPEENENFEKVIYPQLVSKGSLYATITQHRYYSVGSWERIELTKKFFSRQKYIFLDRDGTINVRPPRACYIERPEDFVWLDGAKEAIKLLKDNDYTIILISNQPGIARGNMTVEDLEAIHEKMQKDLLEYGTKKIDQIYYCPHNWDEGCECRKPKPGMFFMAQKDNSLDLSKCYMIGDDDRDMEAGSSAGCKCLQITDDFSLLDAVKTVLSETK